MRKINKIIPVLILTIFLSLTTQAACVDTILDTESLLEGNMTAIQQESEDEVLYDFLLPRKLIGLRCDSYSTGPATKSMWDKDAGERIYMRSEKNASH